MDRRLLLTLSLALVAGVAAAASERSPEKPLAHAAVVAPIAQAPAAVVMAVPPSQDPEAAWVELVFVLDTTGSMGGLLAGAKDTIWALVNDFASQQPRPHVRVGLVAYRDRGDEYVTRTTDLTDDLDAIYMDLSALVAAGGGDTPESVGAALRAAVDDMAWTRDRSRVYRAVYLVGDAPDKGYGGEESPVALAGRAQASGLHVSAIQCGAHGPTATEFARIASAGSGAFTAVAQNGAVDRVETPVDGRLEELERRLAATTLAYGSDGDKAAVQAKIDASSGSSRAVKAARLSVLSKTSGGSVTGEGDLVAAVARGKVSLAALPSEALPESLKGLSVDEQQAQVAQRIDERALIQEEIDQLVAERDAWLETERKKPAAKPSYDRTVVDGAVSELRALGYVD